MWSPDPARDGIILPKDPMAPALAPTIEENRVYECTILLSPHLSSHGLEGALREVEEEVKEYQGVVMERDLWGKRGLAYAIRGQREGNVSVLYFELPPGKLRELDHALRLLKPVLRFLIIRPPYASKRRALRVDSPYILRVRSSKATERKRSSSSAPRNSPTSQERS